MPALEQADERGDADDARDADTAESAYRAIECSIERERERERGNTQYTNAKDENDSQLLPPGQMQLRDDRHGQQQDGEIRGDVHRGVEQPDRRFGQTLGVRDGLCPEGADGRAEEEGAEDGPRAEDDDHAHDDPQRHGEPVVREQPQIQDQDRHFGQDQAEIVQRDDQPQRLWAVRHKKRHIQPAIETDATHFELCLHFSRR